MEKLLEKYYNLLPFLKPIENVYYEDISDFLRELNLGNIIDEYSENLPKFLEKLKIYDLWVFHHDRNEDYAVYDEKLYVYDGVPMVTAFSTDRAEFNYYKLNDQALVKFANDIISLCLYKPRFTSICDTDEDNIDCLLGTNNGYHEGHNTDLMLYCFDGKNYVRVDDFIKHREGGYTITIGNETLKVDNDKMKYIINNSEQILEKIIQDQTMTYKEYKQQYGDEDDNAT